MGERDLKEYSEFFKFYATAPIFFTFNDDGGDEI
jgi:hypothetical protein